MKTQQELFDHLHQLKIAYETFHHEPLFTVDQARVTGAQRIPGPVCKNLFLKDDKKQLWLIVAIGDTKIDLKATAKLIGAPGLRFANDEMLMQYLGVLPGSVTPFGLLNDVTRAVHVILDDNLFHHDIVDFHPLKNDATLVLHPEDLQKFISACGNPVITVDFGQLKIV